MEAEAAQDDFGDPERLRSHRTISATRSDSAAEAAPLIVVPSEVVKGGEDAVEVGA